MRRSIWHKSDSDYFRVTLIIVILLIVGMSCRSSDDEPSTVAIPTPFGTPVPTTAPDPGTAAVRSPTPTIATVTVSPTPATPSANLPSQNDPPVGTAEISLLEMDWSICVLNSSAHSGNGGTAPAPTATPVPNRDELVTDDKVSRENYLARANSIASNLSAWSGAFERLWAFDLNPQQQAAALMIMEVKMMEFCEAVDLLEPPANLAGIHSMMRETTRTRHAWSALAIEHLRSTGSARSESLADGRVTTHALIDEVRAVLEEVSGQIGEVDADVKLDQLGINVSLPTGWYVFGSSRNPGIAAPYELQLPDYEGLGPSNWNKGVSMRIRRFRNSGPLSSAQAAERFSGLASSLGDIEGQVFGKLLGVDAEFISIANSDYGWNFTVVVAVVDGNTYVIDYGCPNAHEEWCFALNDVASSLSVVVG